MAKKEFSPAKITRPRITGIVRRERLFRLLDRGRKRSVLWVSGPAGAGKTTLVASYLDSRRVPCIWYQADEGDADIATFFYYMGLAAKKAAPRRRSPLPLLMPEYLLGINTFAHRYFEELYARLAPPFVLVIDNYQDVPVDLGFHDIIRTGLSLLPEGITAVLISRTDPPPSVARLRANGQMQVLGWDDLVFDTKEAAELVSLKGMKTMTSEASQRIGELSGGWAAGIVLLMEDARLRDDHRPEAIEAVSREDIFDYFASEIFQRTDPSTQDFLVKTAFLPKMTEKLAARLTGMADAGRILSELSRKNYFIQWHIGQEPAFQYHRLFRDFLRARGQEILGPDRMRTVQREAAQLLLEAGQVEDAAELYDKAGEGEDLARLLVSRSAALMEQGRSRTLRTWLDRIPVDMTDRMPWVLFWKGVSRMPASFSEARVFLERAFRGFRGRQDRAGALLAWANIVDTVILEFDDLARLDPWIAWLDKDLAANASYPAPDIGFRVVSSMFVALLFRRTRREEIRPWADRAVAILADIPDQTSRCRLAVWLGLDATWTGDLPRLRTLARDIRQWSQASGALARNGVEAQYAGYVQTLYEWIAGIGDYGYAAAVGTLAIAEKSGIRVIEHHLTARAVFGAFCSGDLETGKKYLDRIHALAESLPSVKMHLFQYHYLPGWRLLLLGDATAALKDAESSISVSSISGASVFHSAFSLMVAAHALLALKRPDESRKHIKRILEIARNFGSPIIEFSGLLLSAHSHLATVPSSSVQRGLDLLRKALELGRTQGYLNTVVWFPASMEVLCKTALEHGIEEKYVRELIMKRKLVSDAPPVHLENWPWRFRLYTLSLFVIVKEGKPLRFVGRVRQKPLDLLKALIALGGRDVAAWSLIEALWPDAEGDTAQRSFDTTLHRLRTMLGNDDALVLREGRLSLDDRFVWVDSWAFERLLGSATEASSRQADERRDAAAPLLEKALALYQGHFLADVSETWAVSMRERLRNKCIRAVMDLGRQWEGLENWGKAVRSYEQGIEIDDLAEEFYRRIMTIYLKQRRYAEGLSVYHRCRKVLRARHGIEPSAETEEIYRRLRPSSPSPS
jgi:DNA-binding SARP family transcriptional activator